MITIVYVHVGVEKTEYINMLRISVASVRKHMKTIGVKIVCDTQTGAYLEKAGFGGENIDIVGTEVPSGYNTVEKSRWLKTKLRDIVRGDFLYIDTDTILCADIADTVPAASVSMVLDEHGLLTQQDDGGAAIKRCARERGLPLDDCTRYFNGGVILAKDDEIARRFFNKWFETWDRTRKPKMHHDQYSLNYVNAEMDVIRELGGEWNCQITATCRAFGYLRGVIVLHYLSAQPHGLYRLNDIDLISKELTQEEIAAIIEHPERQFRPFHTYADDSVEYRLMQSSHFHLIYRMYTRHRGLYHFTEKLLGKLRK